MKEHEIREGDIVEIDYIDELTEERISEGKALVMWKGFNHQPLIHKLDAKHTIWSGYDHITRVVGHVDIERYMEDAIALEHEPSVPKETREREEAINQLQDAKDGYKEYLTDETLDIAIKALEQESSSDLISREAVIKWLIDKDIIKTKSQEENARKELEQLTSVNPQEPKVDFEDKAEQER